MAAEHAVPVEDCSSCKLCFWVAVGAAVVLVLLPKLARMFLRLPSWRDLWTIYVGPVVRDVARACDLRSPSRPMTRGDLGRWLCQASLTVFVVALAALTAALGYVLARARKIAVSTFTNKKAKSVSCTSLRRMFVRSTLIASLLMAGTCLGYGPAKAFVPVEKPVDLDFNSQKAFMFENLGYSFAGLGELHFTFPMDGFVAIRQALDKMQSAIVRASQDRELEKIEYWNRWLDDLERDFEGVVGFFGIYFENITESDLQKEQQCVAQEQTHQVICGKAAERYLQRGTASTGGRRRSKRFAQVAIPLIAGLAGSATGIGTILASVMFLVVCTNLTFVSILQLAPSWVPRACPS